MMTVISLGVGGSQAPAKQGDLALEHTELTLVASQVLLGGLVRAGLPGQLEVLGVGGMA